MRAARGLVCGVFSPPHAGHQLVVDFARKLADEVTIALIVTPGDLIDAELRQSWLSEMFPSNPIVQCAVDEPEVDAAKLAAALPEGSQRVSKRWCEASSLSSCRTAAHVLNRVW